MLLEVLERALQLRGVLDCPEIKCGCLDSVHNFKLFESGGGRCSSRRGGRAGYSCFCFTSAVSPELRWVESIH